MWEGDSYSPVVFDDETVFPTKARDGTLHFPWRRDMTFVRLLDGNQFALQYAPTSSTSSWSRRDPIGGTCYFAGMDESSFVTGIDTLVFSVLLHHGQGEFFDELKPGAIKVLENIWGTDKRTVRQGDIFVHPMGMSWADVRTSEERARHQERNTEPVIINRENGKNDLFPRVRHHIHGQRLVGEKARVDRFDLTSVAVAEGLLSAPDHKDRLVSPGPYLFARTQHLVRPPKLDAFSTVDLYGRRVMSPNWD